MKHINVKLAVIIFGIFIIGVAGGSFVTQYFRQSITTPDVVDFEKHSSESGKSLTNPLLECADIKNISNAGVAKIKQDVEDYIGQAGGTSNSVAVYFRDLNNGPWFGINAEESFIPGSLLKVPLMISVFKMAMVDPTVLRKEVVYNGSEDFNQYYKPETSIIAGKKYLVADLVARTIRFSDNDAAETLFKMLDSNQLTDSYSDLGIQPPENDLYTMTVKTYASFFRILYNATYLNRDFSEIALHLLAATTFNSGIVAGVPSGIVVAHKFGERGVGTNYVQLHDCGIVYAPGKPYVLCIMSKGKSFPELEVITANISRLVYQGVTTSFTSKE